MIRPFKRWNGFCFLQAGLAAFALDIAVFLLALAAGILAAPAAALSYAVGALLHGLLCNRTVFVEHTATISQLRARQQHMFFASALIGLAVTYAMVALLTGAGFSPLAARVIALVASFHASFLIRRRMLLVA